jgi:hypothetical protein
VVTCVERRLGAGAVRQVPDRGPIGLGPAVDRGQRVGLPRSMPLDPQAGP